MKENNTFFHGVLLFREYCLAEWQQPYRVGELGGVGGWVNTLRRVLILLNLLDLLNNGWRQENFMTHRLSIAILFIRTGGAIGCPGTSLDPSGL